MKFLRFHLSLLTAAVIFTTSQTQTAEPVSVDVCVYGATPSGITAAITATQEGASVILIEPSRWVGGILGAGIKPMQDCPEPRSVGGLTKKHIFAMGNNPPALRTAFEKWLKSEEIAIIREHRVQKVDKAGTKLLRLHLEHAPPDDDGVPAPKATDAPLKVVEAKVFIDASYEGDVMAAAKVSYAYGRESSDKYGEKPAGVGPPTNWTPIDPYIIPGDASSGLLPLIDADHGKGIGEGDDYTQAYNFRYYVTADESRRVAFKKPENYSPAQYELVGRYVEYLTHKHSDDSGKLDEALGAIFPGWRNSGEFNYQRKSLVTMAPLGISRFYQDGDWATRSAIWRQHKDYLSGLHYFMSTDPRVPEEFRKRTSALGLDWSMHEESQGWPHQLYVRISRRLLGPYHLTHADVLNTTSPPDSVGLALYGVDTYPARRYAVKNPESGEMGVATEGNMFIGGSKGTGKPYAVPYRAIIPKAEDATNLLVPVCFSASYIAYASARMEPVFCVLGESAATAAVQAIKAGQSVQAIDIPTLQTRLRERDQVIEWKPE